MTMTGFLYAMHAVLTMHMTWILHAMQAEAQQATASAEGARKSTAKGAAAKVRRGKSAAEQAASTNGAAPKKKGGFLSALGLGQDSVYADEEN